MTLAYVPRWNNLFQLEARAAVEKAIEERDGDGCFYCGSRLTRTIDHVTARARGGSDLVDNLVFACRVCNWMKLDQPAWLYALWIAAFGPSRIRARTRIQERRQDASRIPALCGRPFGILVSMGAGGFEPPFRESDHVERPGTQHNDDGPSA